MPPPHHTVQLPLISPMAPMTPNGPPSCDGPALFQSEPHEFTGLLFTMLPLTPALVHTAMWLSGKPKQWVAVPPSARVPSSVRSRACRKTKPCPLGLGNLPVVRSVKSFATTVPLTSV